MSTFFTKTASPMPFTIAVIGFQASSMLIAVIHTYCCSRVRITHIIAFHEDYVHIMESVDFLCRDSTDTLIVHVHM